MADIDDSQRSIGPNARCVVRSPALHPVGRDSFALAAGVNEKCFAAFPTAGPRYAEALGIVAHILIESDYEQAMHVTRGEQLFVDDQYAGRVNPRYARFIIERNPGLTPDAKELIRKGGYRRPDLLLHDIQLREFEEIKSGSDEGKKKGQEQVFEIREWMRGRGLGYALGTNYSPQDRRIPIIEFKLLGVPVEVKLRVQRFVPGVIIYFYCIRTDWSKLIKNLVIGVFIALLAFILARVGIPGKLPNPMPVPTPVLPVPTPTPPIVPIPDPIRVPASVPAREGINNRERSLLDRTYSMTQERGLLPQPDYTSVTLSDDLRSALASLGEDQIRSLRFFGGWSVDGRIFLPRFQQVQEP